MAEEVKEVPVDLEKRDPQGLNAHIQNIVFEEVLGEPDAAHSADCVWINSYKCFDCGKNLCYLILTYICGIFTALYWGCCFGYTAFCHIWCYTPELKLNEMNCVVCQKMYSLIVHCCCDPWCEACSMIFKAFAKN